MAIVTPNNLQRSLPQSGTDTRRQYKLASQARLTGAVSTGAAWNPANLTVASFSRVSTISFDDRAPVRRVRGVRVTEDDLDW
ncbi:hypothetical protein GCM10027601_33680 [Nocardioides ungokensis]